MKINPRIFAVLVIIGLGLYGTGWRFFTNRSHARPVTVNLPPELVNLKNKRNEWTSYLQIMPSPSSYYRKKGKNLTSPSLRLDDPVEEFTQRIIARQIEQLKSLAAMRRNELEAELRRFQNLKTDQMNADIRNKAAELDTRYNKALADQGTQTQEILRNYQLELEESQKTQLTNLHLKIAVLEISHRNDSAEAKEDLQRQIETINRENDTRLQRRQREMQDEEQDFQIHWQQKKTTERIAFENDARNRLNQELASLRQEFQDQYDSWYHEHFLEMLQMEDMWKSKGVF